MPTESCEVAGAWFLHPNFQLYQSTTRDRQKVCGFHRSCLSLTIPRRRIYRSSFRASMHQAHDESSTLGIVDLIPCAWFLSATNVP